MPRTMPACLLSLVLLLPLAHGLDAPAVADARPDLQRHLVAFRDDPGLLAGDAYHGHRVIAVDADLRIALVETLEPALLHATAALDANVRYVERDNPRAAVLHHVPNDPGYMDAGHYGTRIIGAEIAWDKTLGTTAVKVAMLDTGLQKSHEDVAGPRLLQGWDFVNHDNDPNDEGSYCAYHGTHVTGVAGATIDNAKGVAGMSQHAILPVKIFRPAFGDCVSTTMQLVNGLKYAADQGAHFTSNSWGGPSSSSAVNDALLYSFARGVIHVAAAGNNGPCTNCVSQPWKDRGDVSIVVSATDMLDAFAAFSSQGPQVDVAAPGVRIIGLDGTVANGYKHLTGTSVSAAHVTGTAALIKTLNPAFGFSQIESRLTGTALDLGAPGKDDMYGYGRIRANLAVY